MSSEKVAEKLGARRGLATGWLDKVGRSLAFLFVIAVPPVCHPAARAGLAGTIWRRDGDGLEIDRGSLDSGKGGKGKGEDRETHLETWVCVRGTLGK